MYSVGDLVNIGGGTTEYVVTRVWPRMVSHDEYDLDDGQGCTWRHVPEDELTKSGNQTLDTSDTAYDRAMKGI
jgi:hypothetical protein